MYLTQGLHRQVQRAPDEEFTVCQGRSRTSSESVARIARLASAFNSMGIGIDSKVAILSMNSDYFIEACYGTWWVGGVFVPLNYRWSDTELIQALNECKPTILLVGEGLSERIPALQAQCRELAFTVTCGTKARTSGLADIDELIDAAQPVEDLRHGGDALAAILYTGGTTGFPKGVMLSHANLLNSALGMSATGWIQEPGGRYLHVAPSFHVGDFALIIGQTLLGGTHVIASNFDAASTMESIQEHRVTSVLLLGSMIQWMVDYEDFDKYDLSSLRHVFYGAAPIPQVVLEKTLRLLPNVILCQAYGMTEVSPVITLLGPAEHRAAAERPHLLRSAGRAVAHSEVRIVGTDGLEMPRGQVGEITTRGGHVMRGYFNQPDETSRVIRDGWMHTGDGAFMDDEGYVFLVDRIKDMIISGGENVYSGEVENSIMKHPSVSDCAVIGIPDAKWGERVLAIVVLNPGAVLSAADLEAHNRALIAGYKVPRTVEFVEQLPKSAAGKTLKNELRNQYLQEGS